jgi:hypothetical protein
VGVVTPGSRMKDEFFLLPGVTTPILISHKL